MLFIKTVRYDKFLQETGERRIICFGAGGAFDNFVKLNKNRAELLNRIDMILDNNETLNGTFKKILTRTIPIKTLSMVLKEGIDVSNIVIVFTTQYIVQIISQLDSIPLFDQVACYTGSSISRENEPNIDGSALAWAAAQLRGNYSIPKVIHYCWFGKKEMPPLERSCVESWKKYCADYEFVLWNEDNYDVRKCKYMSDAYDMKKWGFVPDYARLDIIYRHGGIYLDTDVELLRNIDEFLRFKAFFSFESTTLVAIGLGFGSVHSNVILKEMLDEYETYSFINEDGSLNMKAAPFYTTDYFKKIGFSICNKMQILNDNLLLPSDYFCPMQQSSTIYELTENTYALHKFSCSWFDKDKRNEWDDNKLKSTRINERLLETWKKKQCI